MSKSKVYFLLIFFVFITSCLFEGKKDPVNPDVNIVPVVPQSVCSSPEDSGAAIGWANVNNATSYNVYMHTEPRITKNNYTKKYENASNPFTVKDLINAKTYYFCVTSVNEAGESGLSVEISCIPKLRDTPGPQTEPAPNFTLPDIDGKNVSLTDFSGKVIILDFWATWCPPCRSEIPHFVELYDTYKDKGLVIIGIDVDPKENASVLKPFAAQYGITYPLLLGTEQVENLYGGIQYIPTTFIIDRNGNIIQEFVGGKAKSVFEEAILKLL
ncbi:MAG: redoxin domain-containing protein [bacterium]